MELNFGFLLFCFHSYDLKKKDRKFFPLMHLGNKQILIQSSMLVFFGGIPFDPILTRILFYFLIGGFQL